MLSSTLIIMSVLWLHPWPNLTSSFDPSQLLSMNSMSLNFQSQKTFINTLLPAGSPENIRFNGCQEAVSDIEYLVGKQCFGFLLETGASILDALLLPINSVRERHHLPLIHAHELLSNYESALFSDVARRNGLNMTYNRPGTPAVPPLRHIPYLLDSFYSSPPTQPRYRLGVATRCWYNEGGISDLIADVRVDYYTGDEADEDEYHTIWIINDNAQYFPGSIDTWSALISSDGHDVQTLLQSKHDHRESSYGNGQFTTPSNQRSAILAQKHTHNDLLSPYATKQTDSSHGFKSTRPKPDIHLERGYNNPPAGPERVPGAPPFETSLPVHELSNCTMEELLSYYPEHVLHWPGLAILYNHYRFRLSNPIFEDSTQYIRNARGKHIEIPKRTFRRATKRTGSQILNEYDTGNFDGHMQPLSEAVQASGQCLEVFLEYILWTPPKDIVLQPFVPLLEVGSTVLNHPFGQFTSRVLAAMQNQMLNLPPSEYATTSHPIIKRCLHGSPEVNETMRDSISLNYYPVHLPEEFVMQHYYAQLKEEPLLYVLVKHSAGAIAHMVPEEACPDQTQGGYKTFAAKLRKRQQMALGQRGERRKVLWKGMRKATHDETYDKLKKEYQEERITSDYGGVRGPSKRKNSEDEDEDETNRTAPSRKRRRTKKGRHGGDQGVNVTNTYSTPGQSIFTGAHLATPSFGSTKTMPMRQQNQIPWTTGPTQQELGFDAPTTFQDSLVRITFPGAPLNTGPEPVYEQFSYQNYDPQPSYGEQQSTFQGSNYNTFDFNGGDVPQYTSTMDPFEQSQYAMLQMPIKMEEIDTSFTSIPTNYDANPQFFPPSINNYAMEREDVGAEASVLPELTSEDWNQFINFEEDSLGQSIPDDSTYGFGHHHAPTNVPATTIPDLQQPANSGIQLPSSHTTQHAHHHPTGLWETQHNNPTISRPAHLTNNEISQPSPPTAPLLSQEEFYQPAISEPPPFHPDEHSTAPPMMTSSLIDDAGNYEADISPIDFEELIEDFYSPAPDPDVVGDPDPDTITRQNNTGLRGENTAGEDGNESQSPPAIDESGVEEWIEGVQEPSSENTIRSNVGGEGESGGNEVSTRVVESMQGNGNILVEGVGEERRGSTGSNDSMASLFG